MSCLELAQELPEPTADVLQYAEDVTVMYGDLAVLRALCRSALLREGS